MMPGNPVGSPGVAVLNLGPLAFFVALVRARGRRAPGEARAKRSGRSVAGIAVQGFGLALAAIGGHRVTLDPLGTKALVEAAVVALLMAAAVGLFVAASHAMGRNWSLVARTRDDHALVTTGPFAHVRHPIYVALFLLLLALAVALGHTGKLWFAMPVYALGTALRVREEERLLRAMFGAGYGSYAARVKRFVPGLL